MVDRILKMAEREGFPSFRRKSRNTLKNKDPAKVRLRFVTTAVYHRLGPTGPQVHSISSRLGLADFSEWE
ncbi:hypothetical protein V1290_004440 [Bradyrhizobium sp. AZCC 1578]